MQAVSRKKLCQTAETLTRALTVTSVWELCMLRLAFIASNDFLVQITVLSAVIISRE